MPTLRRCGRRTGGERGHRAVPVPVQCASSLYQGEIGSFSSSPAASESTAGTKESKVALFFTCPSSRVPQCLPSRGPASLPSRDPGAEGPQHTPLAPPLSCCPCPCQLGLPAPDLSNLSGQEGSSPLDWEAGLGGASPARSSAGKGALAWQGSGNARYWEQPPWLVRWLRPHRAAPFPTCCPSCQMRPHNPVGGS